MSGSPERVIGPTSESRARRLLRSVHAEQQDRYGLPMIDHVERVAAAVPADARTSALVHDIPERSDNDPRDVALLVGLTDDECDALELLTKRGDETLLQHTRRIVDAPRGTARDLALLVKRADIDDHDRRTPTPARVYAQARRLVDAA